MQAFERSEQRRWRLISTFPPKPKLTTKISKHFSFSVLPNSTICVTNRDAIVHQTLRTKTDRRNGNLPRRAAFVFKTEDGRF